MSQSRWNRKALITLAAISCVALPGSATFAQTNTSIENFGVVQSTQMLHGLGFNLTPTNEWEYNLAKQAGAIENRFQCDWRSVEIQTAGNTSGGYTLPSSCVSGLTFSKKYSLQPLIVAAYGAPFHNIVTLQVRSSVAAHSYVIPVTATAGSLSSINVPYCHVLLTSGAQITGNGFNSYAGALITAVDTVNGTITLSAQTSASLSVGATLTVNQLLYPSAATTNTTDASVEAYAGTTGVTYGGYAGFLANSIFAQGLTGRVELWNEPIWAHDPWDVRAHFYDTTPLPSGLTNAPANFGFAAVLQTQTPPGNVRYNWAGTHKTGFNTLLGPKMSPTPTQLQVEESMSSESFHPYTNNPEDAAWNAACLATATTSTWTTCNLEGTNSGNNLKYAVMFNIQNQANHGWKIEQNITETGLPTTNQVAKARYIIRQFLTFQALGIPRINFYRLADSGANYGFVDSDTQVKQQAYTATQRFMNDLSLMPNAATTPPTLPSVVTGTYSGYYPLSIVQVIGTEPTQTLPDILFICWQRSYAPTTAVWQSQASPTPVPVQINIPPGYTIGNATNLNSRAGMKKVVTGSVLTIDVADDPIEVKLTPTP